MLPTIVGLVVALIASSALAVVQTRAVSERDERIEALEADLAALRAEVDQLERDLEDARTSGGSPLGGLLDGLLGGELDGLLGGDLDGLLGDLFGAPDDGDEPSAGGFDGLLGELLAGTPPGAACLVPAADDAGGLGGLLDGLLGGSSATDDLDELVEEVAAQVADLRELSWDSDVEVTVLDDEAIRARLAELTEPDEDALARLRAQEALLISLGAVEPGTDLLELQQDLLGDSVAGFYVSATGETVVRADPDRPLGPADRITLAHELDHALTDQVLGLPDRQAPPLVDDRDADLAALAVIEGDATLIMQQWASAHLSLTDQLSIAFDPAVAAEADVLDELPPAIVADLLFPYTAGLDWVCDTVLDGGWAAVDAAYATPPTTTAQILTGEALDPVDTEVPGDPGSDATVLGGTTFGAADLRFQLQAPGGDRSRALDDPDAAVRAWGGGSSISWSTPDGPAAGIALHDRSDDEVLCSTVTEWAAAANPDARTTSRSDGVVFEGARSAAVRCEGSTVTVGLAPGTTRAERIVGR
ncbi:MAG: hypothetical protein JJT89_05825 [Nitriliruptoraceae bacterium]|nr:hypothetical protein [Nitriliruptoraceae bacterium]